MSAIYEKKKMNHLTLWDEAKIINWNEHWKIRRLKETGYILGYSDLLNRPSIKMNTIKKPIIKKGW